MGGSATDPGRPIREAHRVWLGAHFVVMLAGLLAAGALNRFLTPSLLWVQWVAIGWGAAFAVHLFVFARRTLATLQRTDDR